MAGKKVIGDKERGTRRSDGVGGGKQGHGDKEEEGGQQQLGHVGKARSRAGDK